MENYKKEGRMKSSPYALLLLEIASSLETHEQSSLKLLLQADGYFRRSELEQMSNAQEIFRHMLFKKFIQRSNLKFLKELLKDIRRLDLVKLIDRYNKMYLSDDIPDDTCLSCDTDRATYNNRCHDAGSTYPKEQVEDPEESDMLPSSQESISDDDKILMMEKSSQNIPEFMEMCSE